MSISRHNLSVVIVTLKSEKVIDKCINSIGQDIPIIVIENSNNQQFKNYLESTFKNVECILSGSNLGMGRGNNIGINHSKTDFVYILNPDVILEKNTNISFLGMQLRDMSIEELEEIDLSHGVKVSNNRNSSLYRMGIREGYILTEINSISIKKTDDLSLINSNTKINQMIFFSPEGEKERLIFE